MRHQRSEIRLRHLLRGSVDPDLGRHRPGPGWTLDEALGVSGVSAGEDAGTDLEQSVRPTVVDVGRGEHGDPAVAVLAVVPGKEVGAESPGVLIEPNRSGKPGRYLSVLNWASEYGLSSLTCGRE